MLRVTIKAGLFVILLNRIPVAEVTEDGNLIKLDSELVSFCDVQECMSDNTDIWIEEPVSETEQAAIVAEQREREQISATRDYLMA